MSMIVVGLSLVIQLNIIDVSPFLESRVPTHKAFTNGLLL